MKLNELKNHRYATQNDIESSPFVLSTPFLSIQSDLTLEKVIQHKPLHFRILLTVNDEIHSDT